MTREDIIGGEEEDERADERGTGQACSSYEEVLSSYTRPAKG